MKLGAAAAAAGVTSTALPSSGFARTTPSAGSLAPAGAAPWALVAPYGAGDAIGAWTLARLTAPDHGAVVLELTDGARVARVHVCARSEPPRGLASTDRFDLLVMNGGDGATPSDEPLARAVTALAAVIESNTDDAVQTHPELAALLTHPERVQAFDGAGFDVLT